MPKTIYKYPYPWAQDEMGPADRLTLLLPSGSRVVAFELQRGVPTLWVEQDLANETVRYDLGTFATGSAIPDTAHYLGTIQTYGGDLVWHLYLLGIGTGHD